MSNAGNPLSPKLAGAHRILLSHPSYWPYVRRGAERCVRELSQYLSSRSFSVSILTSKPGASKKIMEGKVRVRLMGQRSHPLMIKAGLRPDLTFSISAFRHFSADRYDLIHSFYFSDGLAARLAGIFKSRPYVLTFAGVPTPDLFSTRRLDRFLLTKALDRADLITVFSRYARDRLWEHYGKEAAVVPGSVDLAKFSIKKDKDFDRPRILCTASLTTRYKNVPLLVRAFELFKKKYPGAVLQLSGEVNANTAHALLHDVSPKVRDSVQILGVGMVGDLPRLYTEAALTVLPSLNEAFGFVLIESLASGTPVVGTESGGIPEVIVDGEVGTLFRPNTVQSLPTNAVDLCNSMVRAMELYRDPETPEKCRAYAEQFGWSVIGPKYEDVYLSASGDYH